MNKSKFHQDVNVYKKLTNPKKYCGKVKQITTRSSWEKLFIFNFLDNNPNIIEWSSEDFFVKYLYEGDGKKHRYYPDFYAKIKDNDNKTRQYIFEVKPQKDLVKPDNSKRNTKSFRYQAEAYIKNKNKFEATRTFCKRLEQKSGIETRFVIITEKELGLKKTKNF